MTTVISLDPSLLEVVLLLVLWFAFAIIGLIHKPGFAFLGGIAGVALGLKVWTITADPLISTLIVGLGALTMVVGAVGR